MAVPNKVYGSNSYYPDRHREHDDYIRQQQNEAYAQQLGMLNSLGSMGGMRQAALQNALQNAAVAPQTHQEPKPNVLLLLTGDQS